MADMNAVQAVYLHLVKCALQCRLTTMAEVIAQLGLAENEAVDDEYLSDLLRHICCWLKERHQPMLNSLIVRASGGSAGKPSSGFWNGLNIDGREADSTLLTEVATMLQQQCFDYYQDVGLGSYALANSVTIRSAAIAVCDFPELQAAFKEQLNRKRQAGETRTVTRNGVVVCEPVEQMNELSNWLDGHVTFRDDVVVDYNRKLIISDEVRNTYIRTGVVELGKPVNVLGLLYSDLGSRVLSIQNFEVVNYLNGEHQPLHGITCDYAHGHRAWNYSLTRAGELYGTVSVEPKLGLVKAFTLVGDPNLGQATQLEPNTYDDKALKYMLVSITVYAEPIDAA